MTHMSCWELMSICAVQNLADTCSHVLRRNGHPNLHVKNQFNHRWGDPTMQFRVRAPSISGFANGFVSKARST